MIDRPYIVVVDDDASVRKALERLLRTARMEVRTYDTADKFLVSLAQREPDCLVLDIRMPGMTGIELRDRLTARNRPLPMIFITAHGGEEAGPEHGASGERVEMLHKPFSDHLLLAAIARAIGGEGTS